jgi:hypothetical protein
MSPANRWWATACHASGLLIFVIPGAGGVVDLMRQERAGRSAGQKIG